MNNRSHNGEQLLDVAIANSNVAEGFEGYLAIFDAFYADHIEVNSGTHQAESVRRKANVRSLLFNFLVPLHVVTEIGGVKATVRVAQVPGDVSNETHSTWTLDLIAPSGVKCTLEWTVQRKWNGARVVYERHYDHHQTGGPLTFGDLHLAGLEVRA